MVGIIGVVAEHIGSKKMEEFCIEDGIVVA